MKMVEIKHRSIMNELNKLNARLERAEKALSKKQAIAEKMPEDAPYADYINSIIDTCAE